MALLPNILIHVARHKANANHSLQHLHTLSWGAQFSKRNSHKACQHLTVCLRTRLSRNLPECFPHATNPASQHLHSFLILQSQAETQKNPSQPVLGGRLKFKHLPKLKGGTCVMLRDICEEEVLQLNKGYLKGNMCSCKGPPCTEESPCLVQCSVVTFLNYGNFLTWKHSHIFILHWDPNYVVNLNYFPHQRGNAGLESYKST